MITAFSPLFWFSFLYFLIAIFLAFFVPGDFFIKKLHLSFFQRLVLGTIFGMVLWAYQGFIFGYLGARWLSYVYLFVTFALWLKSNLTFKKLGLIKNISVKNLDFYLLVLVLLGSLIQVLSVWFTGILYINGMYFCCGRDSLYHIALTNELVKNFPPFEPGMHGVIVRNYHYLGNLAVAELVRIFRLPLVPTLYQFSTVIISLLLGLAAVVFGQILKLKVAFIRWLVFFLYFSGDLIFFLTFLLGKGFNFDLTLLENTTTLWMSPPRVFAIAIFFAGVSLLLLWLKKRDMYTGALMAISLGSLIGFKVYNGLLVLSGLGFLGIFFILKKYFSQPVWILLTFVISLSIYLPSNIKAQGLFFSGFWRFENFIVSPALGLSSLELARVIYLRHNNWIRLIQYEIIYALLYLFSLCGSFLLGLFQTRKSLSFIPFELHIFLISQLLTGNVLGLFFLQKTGGANTSQFLLIIYIIGSIYSAFACYYWIGKIKGQVKILAIIIVVALTIPRAMYQSFANLDHIRGRGKGGIMLDKDQLQALSYLKNNTEKGDLILLDNKRLGISNTSYYFNFLADRYMFLGGIGILQDHDVDIDARLRISDTIFESKDGSLVYRSLLDNNINYIYMSSNESLKSSEGMRFLKNVYNNGRIKILKVI